jgi:hypothetical protein
MITDYEVKTEIQCCQKNLKKDLNKSQTHFEKKRLNQNQKSNQII